MKIWLLVLLRLWLIMVFDVLLICMLSECEFRFEYCVDVDGREREGRRVLREKILAKSQLLC